MFVPKVLICGVSRELCMNLHSMNFSIGQRLLVAETILSNISSWQRYLRKHQIISKSSKLYAMWGKIIKNLKNNFKFRLRFIKHYTKVRSPRSMTMEKSIGATITTLIRISEASFNQNNSAFQMSSKTFPRSTTVAMRIAWSPTDSRPMRTSLSSPAHLWNSWPPW